MKLALKIAACTALLTIAAGCGDGRGPDGQTAEEREKLNRIAENIDAGEVVDTSADSLVANEWEAAESGSVPANGAAAAPAANAAAPAGNRQ